MTRLLLTFVMILLSGLPTMGQQLEPRAYSVSPTGVNIAVFGYGYSTGDLNFDPSIPIDHGSAQINGSYAGYYRSLNVWGKPSNISVAVPYAWGNLQGEYLGSVISGYRSGLSDPVARFAIILYGAQAMKLKEFASYKQRTNIGVSVNVVPPLGQYAPTRLVNLGSNRWALKPEVGVSHAIKGGRFILDAYLGVWVYSDNNNFQGKVRSQAPIVSTQFHLSSDLKRRFWVAFDANFFRGGTTSINGVPRADLQANSRVGGTVSMRVDRRQTIKFAYSVGAYTTIGGAFQTFSFGYNYLWGAGL